MPNNPTAETNVLEDALEQANAEIAELRREAVGAEGVERIARNAIDVLACYDALAADAFRAALRAHAQGETK